MSKSLLFSAACLLPKEDYSLGYALYLKCFETTEPWFTRSIHQAVAPLKLTHAMLNLYYSCYLYQPLAMWVERAPFKLVEGIRIPVGSYRMLDKR